MRPRLRIKFVDFWPSFNAAQNYLVDLLQQEWDLDYVDDPDFLIASSFGTQHLQYNCVRIFYTGENLRPDLSAFDYSFSFDYLDDDRNFRFPLYAWSGRLDELLAPRTDAAAVAAEKTRFCNFVVSSGKGPERFRFFHKLSQYKRVDSAGASLNNVGYGVAEGGYGNPGKLAFLRPYKFTIAFENSSYPGYTTEKITDAMLARSVPIYWGNPLIARDFNPASFINVHDFPSEDVAIEHVIRVDNDAALYRGILEQPYFTGNRLNHFVDPKNILAQFRRIFERGPKPRA